MILWCFAVVLLLSGAPVRVCTEGDDLEFGELYFHKVLDKNQDGLFGADDLADSKSPSFQQAEQGLTRLDVDHSGYVEWEEFKWHIGDPIGSSPEQVHLSLTTDPSQMVVMWVTRDKHSSVVQYGTTQGSYSTSVNGTEDTYDVGLDGWSGWVHTVYLTELQTSTRYFYRVGSQNLWSGEFNFTTPPAVSAAPEEQLFAVVADMGTYIPMGWAVVDQILYDNEEVGPFNMVLHAGDVCYAGTGSEWEIEEVWDVWGGMTQRLAANVPYMFSVGNHEHYYNYTSFLTRYRMPGEQSGGWNNFWYSFSYGNVHFTMMSTEHDYSEQSTQYQWIEQDLAKARSDPNIKWLIVSGHRPMYNTDVSEWSSHSPGAPFQRIIEPLFAKYSVDLYLCGHMHMYERIYPVLNGTVQATGNYYENPKGTAHVVQATAGVVCDYDYINPQPSWSAFRNDFWGYGRMRTNSTHLHYQFQHEETYETVDEFWIHKS